MEEVAKAVIAKLFGIAVIVAVGGMALILGFGYLIAWLVGLI